MGKKKIQESEHKQKIIKKIKHKISEDCKMCLSKSEGCSKGEQYIKNMVPGKAYKGISCFK